jgi:hypothetical protein
MQSYSLALKMRLGASEALEASGFLALAFSMPTLFSLE